MFDHRGELVSLHARNVRLDAEPKGALPAMGPGSAAGLLMADEAALLMLRTGELAGDLWITEGAPDLLTTATTWGDSADPTPAVLGILCGSWTVEIADRVPDGAHVVVAVHEDDAGERYSRRIAETLGSRVALYRWRSERGAAS